MKPSELSEGKVSNGVFLCESASKLSKDTIVSLRRGAPDEVIIVLPDGSSITAKAANDGARKVVEDCVGRPGSCICRVDGVGSDTVMLKSNMFHCSVCFTKDAPLVIAVTEAILYQMAGSDPAQAIERLASEFLLDGNAFVVGRRADKKFRLIGRREFLDVETGHDGVARCVKKLERRLLGMDEAVTLLRGDIRFVDSTLAARIGGKGTDVLNTALPEKKDYLSDWDVYNKLEMLASLEDIVQMKFKSWKRIDAGENRKYIFELDNVSNDADIPFGSDVEAASEIIKLEDDTSTDRLEKGVQIGSVTYSSRERLETVMSLEDAVASPLPPKKGYLRQQIWMDSVRIGRRSKALKKTLEYDTPLLTLSNLIEHGDAPMQDIKREGADSSVIKRAMGGHNPTDNQKKAIDLALNTPDIAIIQGPPGTGKTSVIRALLARLTELAENAEGERRFLLTSEQHEAVDNVAEDAAVDSDLFSLPPDRKGGRHGATDAEKERVIRGWAAKRKEKCKEHLDAMGGRPLYRLAQEVELLIDRSWEGGLRGPDSVAHLVQEILDKAGDKLGPGLLSELNNLKVGLSKPSGATSGISDITKRLLMLIESQRTAADSFMDDGSFQAKRLARFLAQYGDSMGLAALPEIDEAACWNDDETGEKLDSMLVMFCAAIDELKTSLSGGGSGNIDSMERVGKVFDNIRTQLYARASEGRDGVAEALDLFIQDLDDINEVKKMVVNYSQITAGTCQQVAPRGNSSPGDNYDVVIIDEAARANPLDLLIPMSLGKRIVLVGDHRQLPHFLEKDVLDRFYKESGRLRDDLKTSLFERLFTSFDKPGKPIRTITLTDDFRMHPTISGFVSNAFYNGEVKPRFNSAQRSHSLGLYKDKPVCWLDMPVASGGEDKNRGGDKSKSREGEADIIAREVEKALRINSDFSVGVITFYAKQAGLIKEKIDRMPNILSVRVKVGTVDSFQGREFDVVFLSTVRSNGERFDIKKRVGFLDNPNRLCVAFSRAKRLLAVVGDSETVAGTEQSAAVDALWKFYKLCRSDDGYYEKLL